MSPPPRCPAAAITATAAREATAARTPAATTDTAPDPRKRQHEGDDCGDQTEADPAQKPATQEAQPGGDHGGAQRTQ